MSKSDEVVVYSKQRKYKIWRVQDRFGDGPYRECFDEDIIDYHDRDMKNHPAPKYDKGIGRDIEEGEICGFISLWQLNQWFSKKDLKKLKQYGYNVVRIEVSKITVAGNKQVLARR